jgi:hypothetical protein
MSVSSFHGLFLKKALHDVQNMFFQAWTRKISLVQAFMEPVPAGLPYFSQNVKKYQMTTKWA